MDRLERASPRRSTEPARLFLQQVQGGHHVRLPLVVPVGDGLAHGGFLDQQTDLNEVFQILPGSSAAPANPLALEGDDAFSGQVMKRLAHGAGPDAVARDQILDGQLLLLPPIAGDVRAKLLAYDVQSVEADSAPADKMATELWVMDRFY